MVLNSIFGINKLGGFIKKQFIDVIQWENPDPEVLMWRFPIKDQEIQNGAALIVRESQNALFVDEGAIADLFGTGTFTLNTQNLPLLTDLKHWGKLFQSPFKSDVYFFNMRQQLSRRWGTAQPVTIRDNDFGAVSVRSFGMYSFRIAQPELFFSQVSGVCEEYRTETLEEQLRNLAVTQLASAFGNANIPFLDMAANQMLLSEQMTTLLQPAFTAMGLALENFTVESITLPESLQERLDERMGMGIVGDMGRYTQYQTAQAIPLAAQNEGGVAGIGAGLAAGMNIANVMTSGITGAATSAPASKPETADITARLSQLKTLLEQNLISQSDYDSAKAEILRKLTD
ncbi:MULTISPECIES: SPFH domain-containing protein [unclassified Snodgrassella]|uniref:SPFH domain-containing protein n=1 Tax=unclassified Snodgrassella TaxID=2625236 RepID=UPI002269EE16|nr:MULTISPECIES: SPFH domain-containing protein [unclassified Snodgrassella]MCX8749340.1 SPFH domain-containing protein [Snodgrassella sp. B3088]MCX8753988.1 SPFH domain-containing protein [Snodgrassella sp. B3837]